LRRPCPGDRPRDMALRSLSRSAEASTSGPRSSSASGWRGARPPAPPRRERRPPRAARREPVAGERLARRPALRRDRARAHARHAPRGRRAVHQIASDAVPRRREPRVLVGGLIGAAALAAFAAAIWLGVTEGNAALALLLASGALIALGVVWIELRLQTAKE